jgi:hypothetical protein
MRELKVTYDVYPFEELPAHIQDKLIENEIEILRSDWDCVYSDDIIDDWKEKLESQGFNNPEINYRGFWSQGDGASFTTNSIDLIKLCDYLELWPVGKEKTYRTLLENLSYTTYLKRTNHHYYHEKSTTFYCFVDCDQWGRTEAQNALDKFVQDIEPLIDEHIVDMGIAIYRDLQEDYEAYTSEEFARQQLIELGRDYVVDKDGNYVKTLDPYTGESWND